MFLHHNLDNSELADLLAVHTNRLMQIIFYGENYTGEYHTCKTTIEIIQKEIMSRQAYHLNPLVNQGQTASFKKQNNS